MKPLQLTIAEPCHENWNQMLPEEQGKFCMSCQKTVVDFTAMSDREVLQYFSTDTGSTCGRFYEDQLNRKVSVAKERTIGRWKYLLQLLLPAIFAMHKAKGQKLMGKVFRPSVQQEQPQKLPIRGSITEQSTGVILKGNVTNNEGKPVPYASVTSADGQHAVIADSLGNFILKMKQIQSIKISSIGFTERTVAANELMKMKDFKIGVENGVMVMSGLLLTLASNAVNLDDVVVVGYGTTRRVDIMGSVTSISVNALDSMSKIGLKVKKMEQPKRPFVNIYPNPIQPQQDFNIHIKVPKLGHYLLEILDASGKLIQAQPLNMTMFEQTETIVGNRLQQAGIYIINLKSKGDKNIFSSKLLVQ